MLRDLEDHELAALATTGERAAFGELARRHSATVRSLIRRMGAQPALADDVAQDAFVIAFERINTFRNDGPFGAWLNRIAARLYTKRWLANSRIELFADPTEFVMTESSCLAPYESIDLDHALRSLNSAERLCVSLCHGAGLSHAEIANELKLPLGTVKSHIKRGLDKLKALLAPSHTEQSSHG